MMNDQISAEEEAVQSLADLLAQAKKCRMLYERANMSLPEPLRRALGMNGLGRAMPVRPRIPPLERQTRPQEAQENWISIETKYATPTTLGPAILRAAKKAMRAKDVVAAITRMLPDVHRGSIANIGARLEGKVINRTSEGWTLIDQAKAGILHGGMLWGPPEIFGKTELAAHRREAILHLLGCFPGGLQIIQIVEQLRECAWIKAPINKDLVKADMGVLGHEGKVRRVGNSKKWEIAPNDKG
jgi:hypothetical protein